MQIELLPTKGAKKLSHGGGKSRAHAKTARPIQPQRWMHLVLKSPRAKGSWSFLSVRNRLWIERTLRQKAQKFGVTIGDYANVGNHLHVKVKCHNREYFRNFLRAVTTLIARRVTGARRGVKVGRFWEGLAFTRVLKSSLEELRLKGYFRANRIEAVRGSSKRTEFLQAFNLWVKGLKRIDSTA